MNNSKNTIFFFFGRSQREYPVSFSSNRNSAFTINQGELKMNNTLNGKYLKKVIANQRLLNTLRVFLGLAIINYVLNRINYNWNVKSHALFYFTIQSNLLCAAYWMLSWIPAVRRNSILVLATTLYITVTGTVFIIVLDIPFTDKLYELLNSGKITAEVHYFSSISSTGTHYIMPFLALMDFLIFIEIKDIKFR